MAASDRDLPKNNRAAPSTSAREGAAPARDEDGGGGGRLPSPEGEVAAKSLRDGVAPPPLPSDGRGDGKPAARAFKSLVVRSSPSNANSPQEGRVAAHNWQAAKFSVKERLSFVYNTDTLADVYFVVGPPELSRTTQNRFPAHKLILAIGSAVFDAMFNGPMSEGREAAAAEIAIPDVEPGAFLALLRFLYTDEVDIDSETVMSTLYAAKKYSVPALESACVEFLKTNVCSENAFALLTQARAFDEPHLAKLCLDVIDRNTSEALLADGFAEVDLDTLCAVLERDSLGVRESKLFQAVRRWSEAECARRSLPAEPESQRELLGRALRLLRFPLMTIEEFAAQVAQSRLLTDAELVELFCYFAINPKPPVSFCDTPRCCAVGKERLVSRFCQIEHRWGYSGTSDKIKFIVNKKIYIIGFGLYGSVHGPAEYAVTMQVVNHDSQRAIAQTETSFTCDGSSSTFRVLFREPVEILQNTHYIAVVTLKGPDSYYGTKGLRKVTYDAQASGKVTFQFSYAAGNNNGTSVEDGQLPEIIFYI